MNTAIEINGLTKVYGELTAVDHVSYNIQEGEIFGLLGPNGCGKTTTILMLLGLIIPTEGTAIVNGANIVKDPIGARRSVGLLTDNVGLYENLTAKQNLAFFAELSDLKATEASARVDKLLALVGLSEKQNVKVSTMSRGMRQRLGVAQSLVRDPKIMVLDEPTLGIDPEGTKELRGIIKMLSREQGKTIIFTSHLLNEVNRLCDRVAIMKTGKVIAIGTIPELRKQINAAEGDEFEEVFLRYQGVV
ncbi:ABC transporter ATP-binding protein [archaeon]|nr:MAG: ABC transporter ATP-binding protein [archaeon]